MTSLNPETGVAVTFEDCVFLPDCIPEKANYLAVYEWNTAAKAKRPNQHNFEKNDQT